jgi:hypothetical protein
MSGQRQKSRHEQEVLAFPVESRSDAPKTTEKGTETRVAKRKSESLAGTERLMEEVCELENSKQALQRVKANKGSPGVDGMTVEELPEYLKGHGPEIGKQLRNGSYQPRRSRPTCGAGPAISATVKRLRCCKVLNRGCAVDSGRWCGSKGSADGKV